MAEFLVAPAENQDLRPSAERRDRRRAAAWGGVLGPVAFAGAWLTGGILRRGYDPVEQAISRLAETGASSRVLMTAGFVGFSAGVLSASPALARHLGRPAGIAAAATALATVGVALTPLNADVANPAHSTFAVIGYATLAAAPLVAVRPLARRGLRVAAEASAITGLLSAAVLASTATGWSPGLLQRLGLSLGHAWLALASAAVATGRLRRDSTRFGSS